MAHRVYISPSVQDKNIGYGNYGTEEKRMQRIGDEAVNLLNKHGNFVVFRNKPEWTLAEVVKDSNSLAVELHVALHSDAGAPSAEGTSVFYCEGSANGEMFAKMLYAEIAPMSVGKDRGVKADSTLYANGLYETRKTIAPAVLIEVGFHTNPRESEWIINETEAIGYGVYKAICKYFGENPKVYAKDSSDMEKRIEVIEKELAEIKKMLKPKAGGSVVEYRKEGITHVLEVNPLDLYAEIVRKNWKIYKW